MKLKFNKYGPKRVKAAEPIVDENEEIETLRKRIIDESPQPGTQQRRLVSFFAIFLHISLTS
jgi:hypothetical protein